MGSYILLYKYSMICWKAHALPVLSDFCERNSYAAQLSRLHTLIMYFSLSLRSYFVCFWVISWETGFQFQFNDLNFLTGLKQNIRMWSATLTSFNNHHHSSIGYDEWMMEQVVLQERNFRLSFVYEVKRLFYCSRIVRI